MVSVDWQDSYSGIIPCADCEGIQIRIVLNSDLTYTMESRYNGKDENIRQSKGKFTWTTNGSKIILEKEKQTYLVGENQLIFLDQKGNRITGDLASNYILNKESQGLTGKNWKLIELKGNKVVAQNKVPFISFSSQENRVNGNSSCNSFFGTYEIADGNKIRFSNMGMTRMACIGNTVEDTFMQVLNNSVSFKFLAGQLILEDEKNNEIARFESDYFLNKK